MKNHEQEDDAFRNFIDRIITCLNKFGIYPSLVRFQLSLNDDGSRRDFSFGLVTKEELLKLCTGAPNEFPGVSIDPNNVEEVTSFWEDQAKRMDDLKKFCVEGTE